MIRSRVPLIKSVSSIITIGTGGSAGQEGPIAQIGSGFGSYLARVLKLPPSERRILMLAGAAGGHWRHLPGTARRCSLCRRSSLFLDGLRIGSLAPLPGQLDRGLFDVCPVHHARSRSSACPTFRSRACETCPLRRADRPLRGLRLALCPCLLRFARQALQAHAHPETAQAGRGRVLAGPAGPGLPPSHDRRLRLGSVGSDRHAAGTDPSGRVELCSSHGNSHAPDPLRA